MLVYAACVGAAMIYFTLAIHCTSCFLVARFLFKTTLPTKNETVSKMLCVTVI